MLDLWPERATLGGLATRANTIRLSGQILRDRLTSVTAFGRLASGKTAFDTLGTVLLVGTVSEAPKGRAMQIIGELDTTRPGPYAWAVGCIDFAGNLDPRIALRTLVTTEGSGGQRRVYARVGAGIVADSDPSAGCQETLDKAQGMLRAIEVAESWSAPQGYPLQGPSRH
jgi:anthranilate synthase component 1